MRDSADYLADVLLRILVLVGALLKGFIDPIFSLLALDCRREIFKLSSFNENQANCAKSFQHLCSLSSRLSLKRIHAILLQFRPWRGIDPHSSSQRFAHVAVVLFGKLWGECGLQCVKNLSICDFAARLMELLSCNGRSRDGRFSYPKLDIVTDPVQSEDFPKYLPTDPLNFLKNIFVIFKYVHWVLGRVGDVRPTPLGRNAADTICSSYMVNEELSKVS